MCSLPFRKFCTLVTTILPPLLPVPIAPPRDLSWLKELHLKIWNREDIKPRLFRKVEVTREHYDVLQSA